MGQFLGVDRLQISSKGDGDSRESQFFEGQKIVFPFYYEKRAVLAPFNLLGVEDSEFLRENVSSPCQKWSSSLSGMTQRAA